MECHCSICNKNGRVIVVMPSHLVCGAQWFSRKNMLMLRYPHYVKIHKSLRLDAHVACLLATIENPFHNMYYLSDLICQSRITSSETKRNFKHIVCCICTWYKHHYFVIRSKVNHMLLLLAYQTYKTWIHQLVTCVIYNVFSHWLGTCSA